MKVTKQADGLYTVELAEHHANDPHLALDAPFDHRRLDVLYDLTEEQTKQVVIVQWSEHWHDWLEPNDERITHN